MLLDSAEAFEEQVAPYRSELFAHCYRMMGTVDEAEDALQEALTRAWQGRHTFRRSFSVKAWLYRIVTNVCLNAIEVRRRDRVEAGPCPDELLTGIASPDIGPDARYDAHESVSLAFLTVLQVLPPRQRAALLLRDVLTFRSAEVALLLDTSVQAVNSSLQRARTTLRGIYTRSGHSPAIDSARRTNPPLLERYVRAWEAADVAGLVAILREDAVLRMPPKPMVIGAMAIGEFLSQHIFAIGPMRLITASANESPAFAAYMREALGQRYLTFALLVIGVDGDQVTHIYAYSDPQVLVPFGLPSELAG